MHFACLLALMRMVSAKHGVVGKSRNDEMTCILGVGAVYGYDAVGSFKRDVYGAMGSGQNFIMPLLDNLVGHFNLPTCEISERNFFS